MLVVIATLLWTGRPQDGVIIDDDFFQTNHQDRFSHTRSDIDGSGIFYVSADFGLRALEWQTPAARGFLDTFVGYQYWNEEYVAFGLTGGGPGLLTSTASRSTKIQTEDISFRSVRLGLRTQVPVVGALSLRGTVVVLPFTHTRPPTRGSRSSVAGRTSACATASSRRYLIA